MPKVPGPWGTVLPSRLPDGERFPGPALQQPGPEGEAWGDFSPILRRQPRIFLSHQPEAKACPFGALCTSCSPGPTSCGPLPALRTEGLQPGPPTVP